MKEVEVQATFESSYTVEVPDDWEWDGTLDHLLTIDDLSSAYAELVDWNVRKRHGTV